MGLAAIVGGQTVRPDKERAAVKATAAATPIAITILAVVAAAYAYIVDRRTVSDADRAARRRDVFPSFRAEDVARVEMEHGGEALALERDVDAGASAAWLMTSPRRERADATAVDTLLRELELAARLREVGQIGGLGLDAPRVRGAVTVGPLRYGFALGADTARPEGGAYMRVDGEGTFVVDRSLKVQLLRGADAYRDRVIVPLGANEIARVDVRAADGRAFALERSGVAFHVAGSQLRASRGAVEHIFAALADARAESFLDPQKAELVRPPVLTVTVAPRSANQTAFVLHVGAVCPGQPDEVVLLRASPSVVETCTAKALVDALASTAESLVDTSALSMHADEIEQIRLETIGGGGTPVDLARKSTGWHERAPEDRDLDSDESDSANELAVALADARALDVRHAGPDDRIAARTRATFGRTGGGASEVLELEPPGADGSVLARRIEDDAVLRLPRAVARRFEPHPVALRSRAVWRPSFDPGAVVAVDNGCTPVRERLELHNGTWMMRAPEGFTADARSIDELAGTIAHARADAWAAESDDGTFGFDRSGSCTVTLVMNVSSDDALARRVSIVFGADEEPGVYARVAGDAAVFVAPRTLRDLLSHPTVDRSRLRLDPSALKSVTLVRGTARLVLERSGERLIRSENNERDAAEGAKLEAALAAFYAQTAVHIGPPTRDEGMDRPTLEIRARSAAMDAGPNEVRIAIGAPGRVDAADVYFARASGVDATFAVPRRVVGAILDAW
jgi:hypothetical protein